MNRPFSPEDQRFYVAMRGRLHLAGWSYSQIQRAMAWATGLPPGLDEKGLIGSFQDFAAREGLSPEAANAAIAARSAIVEHGVERFLPKSTPELDAQIIADAEETLKQNPDAYWDDPLGRELYNEALERRDALQTREQTAKDQAAKNLAAMPVGQASRARETRAREIEQKYMRAPPGSPEWKEYYQGPLQGEYRELMGQLRTGLDPTAGGRVTPSQEAVDFTSAADGQIGAMVPGVAHFEPAGASNGNSSTST